MDSFDIRIFEFALRTADENKLGIIESTDMVFFIDSSERSRNHKLDCLLSGIL